MYVSHPRAWGHREGGGEEEEEGAEYVLSVVARESAVVASYNAVDGAAQTLSISP